MPSFCSRKKAPPPPPTKCAQESRWQMSWYTRKDVWCKAILWLTGDLVCRKSVYSHNYSVIVKDNLLLTRLNKLICPGKYLQFQRKLNLHVLTNISPAYTKSRSKWHIHELAFMLNQCTVYSCSHPEKTSDKAFFKPQRSEMTGITIHKTGYALGIRLERGLSFY